MIPSTCFPRGSVLSAGLTGAIFLSIPKTAHAAVAASSEALSQNLVAESIRELGNQLGLQNFTQYLVLSSLVTFLLILPASRFAVGHEVLRGKNYFLYYGRLLFLGLLAFGIGYVAIRMDLIKSPAAYLVAALVPLYRLCRSVHEMTPYRVFVIIGSILLCALLGDLAAERVFGKSPAKSVVIDEQHAGITDAVDLQKLYAELQTQRARLDVNDAVAVLKFNQQVAAYDAAKTAAASLTKPNESSFSSRNGEVKSKPSKLSPEAAVLGFR